MNIHRVQGRLVDQRPVHLFDPINDYVISELRERFVPRIMGFLLL